MRVATTRVLVLATWLASGAMVAAAAAQPPTHTVTIEGMQYNPAALMVHRGERVVWLNKDLFPHTVTAVDKTFDSQGIAANASWSYVATRNGEYAYGCRFHPTMKGRLTVQ